MPITKKIPAGIDYIITYSTDPNRDTPHADYLTYLAINRAKSGLPPASGYYPRMPAKGLPIQARVDLGRWLVSCEACGAGVCIEPDTPVYMCPKCDRSGVWRRVVMPSEREKIEEVLLMRPGFRDANLNRFWFPGETLLELATDNVFHGSPVPGYLELELDRAEPVLADLVAEGAA